MKRFNLILAVLLNIAPYGLAAKETPAAETVRCVERLALVWLDREARTAVGEELSSEEFAELRNLSARHLYVEGKVSQRSGDEESTLSELEAEEQRLRPVRTAYAKLSREIQERQELFTELRFGDGPLAIELIRESERLNTLRPAAESARAALAEYRRGLPAEEFQLPCAHSRRGLKMFRRMPSRAQQKAIDLLKEAMESPYAGDIKTTFPHAIRFLAFSSQGSYRLVYEIKSDGKILLHGVGPRQNFYEEFTDLQ